MGKQRAEEERPFSSSGSRFLRGCPLWEQWSSPAHVSEGRKAEWVPVSLGDQAHQPRLHLGATPQPP